MALFEQDNASERSEPATPRRREEAREEGRYAYSAELVGGVVMITAFAGLALFSSRIGGGLIDLFREQFSHLSFRDMDVVKAREIATNSFSQFLSLVGPIFAVLIAAALASNVVQVGWHFTPQKLEVNFDRINPSSGWQKLFSGSNVIKAIAGLLKVVVLAAAIYFVLRGRFDKVMTLGHDRLPASSATAWSLILRTAFAMISVLALFGLIDYIREWRRFEASIRMTMQEIKEEHRREEGDPLIKRRVRQLQRERAGKKMMQAVPRATVVVTNPTHFAVALEYRAGTKAAPKVVAKGTGAIALRIVEIARAHGVSVLERPPVARALFRMVPVGAEIPMEMFRVVAEIIATVYRLRGAA